MKHYVIYVPGLGDHHDGRRWLIGRGWQLFGVKMQLVPMQWDSGEAYQQKALRLKQAIVSAQQSGYTVSLIGESAGASIALNVAADTPGIHHIVTLAGVTSSDLPIWPVTKKRSPSFVVSASKINDSLKHLDTSRIHTVHALIDRIVSPRYNDIVGAHNHQLLSVGHIPTIVLCLTLFSPFIVSLIKKP